MIATSTKRLALVELTASDAPFVFRLYTDPDFLRFIGDRGIDSQDSARHYVENGPMKSYRENGFGLYVMKRSEDELPIGVCGLLKRDFLEIPDLGFAVLPEFRRKGYVIEAAEGILRRAWDVHNLDRVAAIVSPENAGSIALLERLGFSRAGSVRVGPGSPEVEVYEIVRPA